MDTFGLFRAVFFFLLASAILLVIFFAPALTSRGSSSSVQTTNSTAAHAKLGARVPFVGCKSDGQVGPVEAPKGESVLVPIAAEAAQKLAYYKSENGIGVLAPRGWSCFGVYGSNDYVLYVSPQPITAPTVLSANWSGFDGPAIELAESNGDTSGRFEVARIIARVFPAHRSFVDDAIAEGIEPASSFPSGPYPSDKLTYRSKDAIEFVTPANTEGLGTNSRLKKNATPISGVAILMGEAPDLLLLSVRLSPKLTNLTSDIVQQTERDVSNRQ